MNICGATITDSGKPCRKPAGAGTPHRGSGFCFYHDKTSIIISDDHRTRGIHLRSEHFRRRVMELQSDPKLLELDKEIAFARVLLERVEHGTEDIGEYPRPIIFNMILQTIGRLVERRHRIEMERKGTVKISFVVSLMDAWSKALNELIADPNLRQMIGERVTATVTQTLPIATLREITDAGVGTP